MRFIILLLLIPCYLMGQGVNSIQANQRVVGSYSGPSCPNCGGSRISTTTFGVDTFSINTQRLLISNGANISDESGNLLFYTDGLAIMNVQGNVIPNGDSICPTPYAYSLLNSLGGYNFPQSSFIFQNPGDSSKYTMIHSCLDDGSVANGPLKVWKSKFQVNANDSISVIEKNVTLINDTVHFSGIVGCKHANGRDWWVVIKKWNSTLHYSLLFTLDSIYSYINNVPGTFSINDASRTVFSTDGSKYATYDFNPGLRLFDFNRCTGQLSLLSTIPDPDGSTINGFSGNFSPNGNYFYFNNFMNIYRINMSSNLLPSDVELVRNYTPFVDSAFGFQNRFHTMEVGNDGKLYIGGTGSCRYYCTIDNPDALDIADIGYHHFEFQIPYFNNHTYTNHANYGLGQLSGSPCDTLGLTLGKLQLKTLGINIGPNPNNGHFYVNFTEQKISGALEIYDLNGQLLHSEYIAPWSNTKQVNLQHKLSNGMYALRLSFGEQTGVVKFVVEK
jgi:hypothetical protein